MPTIQELRESFTMSREELATKASCVCLHYTKIGIRPEYTPV